MKSLKDYLHLYLNSNVSCLVDTFTTHTEPLNIVNFNILCNGGYKPILRPLSSMTEWEAKAIHSIQHGGHPDTYISKQFDIRRSGEGWSIIRLDSMDTKLIVTDNGNLWKTVEEENQPPHLEPMQYQNEILRFLLFNGFDLFGLIEAGLAIELKN